MPGKARAQTATDDKQNNVWFTDKAGRRTRPTADGKNSDPDLSPDGHRVAYVRNGMGKPISTGAATPTELRVVGADGKNPETLVRSAETAEVEEALADTSRPGRRASSCPATTRRLYPPASTRGSCSSCSTGIS